MIMFGNKVNQRDPTSQDDAPLRHNHVTFSPTLPRGTRFQLSASVVSTFFVSEASASVSV